MEEVKADYYDCDDGKEYLSHEDKDDAIEEHLDDLEDLPEEVTVYGFKRGVVNAEKFREVVLEGASEYLSENYGGEDGHEINDAIREAAGKFIEVYLANYSVWNCYQCSEEKINVREWCEKHRPDYLKDIKC